MKEDSISALDRMIKRGNEYTSTCLMNSESVPALPNEDQAVRVILTDGSELRAIVDDYDNIGVTLLQYNYTKKLWQYIFIPWVNIRKITCT